MTKEEVLKEAIRLAADPSVETLVAVAVRDGGTSETFVSSFSNSALVCQAVMSVGQVCAASKLLRVDGVAGAGGGPAGGNMGGGTTETIIMPTGGKVGNETRP